MPAFLSQYLGNFPALTPTSVIDILLVAFLVYQFISIVRGRRAAHIMTGIWILGVVYLVARRMHLELLRSILEALAPYTAFGLIVMFQSEIRRLLARIGRSQFLALGKRLESKEVTDEILLAVSQMGERKIGALIVIERDIGLRTFIESGVALDAFISRDLLCSIFERGGALHDGAAILQGERIAAAACFLPLTMNPGLMRKVGTRHRAAIGITEETDCIAIVVSEETGRLSIATFGEIEFDVSLKRLEDRITKHGSARDKNIAGTVTVGLDAAAARQERWGHEKR